MSRILTLEPQVLASRKVRQSVSSPPLVHIAYRSFETYLPNGCECLLQDLSLSILKTSEQSTNAKSINSSSNVFTHLPILRNILSYADDRTLARCFCVNHLFFKAAGPILYHKLSLENDPWTPIFKNAIDLLNSSSLKPRRKITGSKARQRRLLAHVRMIVLHRHSCDSDDREDCGPMIRSTLELRRHLAKLSGLKVVRLVDTTGNFTVGCYSDLGGWEHRWIQGLRPETLVLHCRMSLQWDVKMQDIPSSVKDLVVVYNEVDRLETFPYWKSFDVAPRSLKSITFIFASDIHTSRRLLDAKAVSDDELAARLMLQEGQHWLAEFPQQFAACILNTNITFTIVNARAVHVDWHKARADDTGWLQNVIEDQTREAIDRTCRELGTASSADYQARLKFSTLEEYFQRGKWQDVFEDEEMMQWREGGKLQNQNPRGSKEDKHRR